MNSNGNNHRGSMSPSSNPVAAVAGVGQGAPTGGLHMAAAQAAVAAAAGGPPVAVQTAQATGVQAATAAGMGAGGLAGVGGINNDGGLSSSFNPANPLAGVYSPKTSHLSIAVQQQLEQAEQAAQAAVVYQQQQPQIMASAASAAAATPVSAVATEAAADINELPLPPGWSVDYTMRGT